MQEVFEKIIEKLETYSDADEAEQYGTIPVIELDRAIEIVKQEAEQYNVIIDGEYCFQSCGCTEMCGKCSRIANGDTDYYESICAFSEQYNNGWIPFVQREMTEDEKESFGDLNFMLDCQLPDEDEEILITYKFKDELYVDVDTFMRDGSECYLDSGRDFVTEAVAWCEKPAPYQPNRTKGE